MPTNQKAILYFLFELGLTFIIIGLPFSKSLIQVGTYVSILAGLGCVIQSGDKKFPLILKPWLIFLGFCFLSIWISEFPLLSLRAFFTKYLKYFLLVWVLYELLTTQEQLKRLLWTTGSVLAVVIVNGLLQYKWGIDITGNKSQVVYII